MKDGKYILSHPDLKLTFSVIVNGDTMTYIDGAKGKIGDLKEWVLTPVEFVPPLKESLTCFNCDQRDVCKFVDDPYNTNGDCLAMK